jgi:hypothetical protein
VATRKASLDNDPDETGREEGKRDRHVHFTLAATLVLGGSLDAGCRIIDELIKSLFGSLK